MKSRETPNDRKFKELILFVAQRSLPDPRFGSTKQNKLLFFSDFAAYKQLGNAITWQPYQKLKRGPAPRKLLPILREMSDSGDAAEAKHMYFGLEQCRTIALRDPDLSEFSADEIAIVTDVISYFWDYNATKMSEFSHLFSGWTLAEEGEDIPYEVALVHLSPDQSSNMDYSNEFMERLEALDREPIL